MPLFAEIDNANHVLRVIVAGTKEWCESRLGGTWVETFQEQWEQYAGIGMGFDPAHPKRFAPDWSEAGQTQLPDGEWLYNTQGQYVFHSGKVWTNLLPNGSPNVWEPGVANWRQYQIGTNYTQWIQPSGSFDSYPVGFRVEHNGKEWESNTPANVWEPGATGITQWTDLNPPSGNEWAAGVAYVVNDEVLYNGVLYRCTIAHSSIVGWEPPNVPALWSVVT
jgi:hypothetical protein